MTFESKKIHKITFFKIAISIGIFVWMIYFVSWLTVMGGFTKLEKRFVERNIARSREVVEDRINNIALKLVDWSIWDDTYAFIEDRNEAYIKSNLTTNALDTGKIDMMAFLNSHGELVYFMGRDAGKEQRFFLEELESYLAPGSAVLKHPDEKSSVSGIIIFSRGPMMIVSKPIVTSEGKGPVRGTIIFAAYLNAAELKHFGEIIKVDLDVQRFDAISLPPDFTAAREAFGKGQETFIKKLDTSFIAGYSVLKDINGKPALILKVTIPREITQFGRQTLGYFFIALILVGFIFGFMVYVPLSREIRVREQVEQEIAKINEAFLQLAKHSRTVVWEVDAKGLYTYVSDMSEAVWGYSPQELMGRMHFYDLHPQEGREEFKQAAFAVFKEKGSFKDLVNAIETKDGRQVWVSTNGIPLLNADGSLKGYRGNDTDITARKQAEDSLNNMRVQMVRADKLSTLGEMASGMAHEMNQPLAGISLVADSFRIFMRKKILTDEKVEAGLKDISDNIQRMTNIINHVRVYARQETVEFGEVDIPQTIDSALILMGAQLRVRGIELTKIIESNLPWVMGNAHQLEQVWINFISNARDAMDEKQKQIDEGKLKMPGYQKSLSIAVLFQKDDGRILITFTDNGIGVSPDVLKKAFEPFFTTKEVGRGTGLGLSISHGIIQSHKGTLNMEGWEGQGVTLKVYLPVLRAA
ncbi:MAG: PAS domain S-box protein [Candidatus Omnitrophica bacterium]|nr:PAS domain S-box protein [Candidatus Omnitrophota bacterium]